MKSAIRNPQSAITVLLLALALGAVYLRTVDRSYGGGDVAEVQLASIHLGICHPPGYALHALVGHLFTKLPIGGAAGASAGERLAHRVNLLSAVSGVACCLLVYGALRNLGLARLAAAAAALLLGFSDLFWRHARYAEVYTFHTMIVATAVFGATRYLTTRRPVWLALEWLALGAACSARPSDLLFLPAFAVFHLWCGAHKPDNQQMKQMRTPWLAAIATASFLLPYVYVFGYFFLRDRPDTVFNYVNDYTSDPRFQPVQPPLTVSNATAGGRAQRALWVMSVGQFRSVITPAGHDMVAGTIYYLERFGAADLGVIGVVLAGLGVWQWRRRRTALVLPAGIWLGNFALYLVYQSWDRITFTLPGLMSLAMLSGAGVQFLIDRLGARGGRVATIAVLIAAGVLALRNFARNDAAREDRLRQVIQASLDDDPLAVLEPLHHRDVISTVRADSLPPNACVMAPFILGRALQYELTMVLGRGDVHVAILDDDRMWPGYLSEHRDGRPAFALSREGFRPLFAP